MSSNRGKKFPPEILSPTEIEALLRSLGRGVTAKRNAAAIVLMWRGGLRCAESLSVRRCDLELIDRGAILRILKPKGAGRGVKPRVLALGKRTTDRIMPWLTHRDAMGISETAPLCCTLKGEAVCTSYFRHLFPRLARRAGIDKRVHAHALRHTFAWEATLEGKSMPWVSNALGHTDLLTTQRYLNHLAPADVIEGMLERD